MRRLKLGTMAMLCAVSACQSVPSAAKRAASPTRTAIARSAPSAGPSATAAPTVPMRAVQGSVRIDAHYAIAEGVGALLSNNGGGIISDNGLGIISNNGGGVMVVDGRAIRIGAGIVSNNGGGIISDNGLGYRTLAGADVPLGQVLPVKGMGVVAVSLLTGQPVSVAVLTDAQGRYRLEVPEAIAENVRLVAKVPTGGADDKLQRDDRFEYDLITAPEATGELNEDTRVSHRFLRRCALSTAMFLLTDGQFSDANFTDPSFTGPVQALMLAQAGEVREALGPKTHLSDAQRAELAQRLIDTCLAFVEVDGIEVDAANTIWRSAPPGTKAMKTLGEILKAIREAATTKMLADPTYFSKAPYVTGANARRAGEKLPPYDIRRPSDFLDFIFEEYLADDHARYDAIIAPLGDLGFTEEEAGINLTRSKISACTKSIFLKVAMVLIANPDAKAKVLKLVKSYGDQP